jgi:hypothetical protein
MIQYRSGDITDVRLGDTPIKSVCVGAVEVWSAVKPKPWLKTFVDQGAHNWFNGSWVSGPAPDLSDKPTPVKGSIVFSMFIMTGITMGVVIFDGTTWVEDPQSFRATTFQVDLHGSSYYGLGRFFSGPTAKADMDTYLSTFGVGPDTTKCYVCVYAEADGLHIVIADQDGGNPTNFVNPYPAGVTLADMPPTQDFN